MLKYVISERLLNDVKKSILELSDATQELCFTQNFNIFTVL